MARPAPPPPAHVCSGERQLPAVPRAENGGDGVVSFRAMNEALWMHPLAITFYHEGRKERVLLFLI